MMESLYLSKTIRIVDLDKIQYALQFMTSDKDKYGNERKPEWKSQHFCPSLKSLVRVSREVLRDRALSKARAEANIAFDASGFAEKIMALPPKLKSEGKKGLDWDG